MSEWRGLHNQERHHLYGGRAVCDWCSEIVGGGPCYDDLPCRCCLAAEVERLTAVIQRVHKVCQDPYVGPPTEYGEGFQNGYNDALTIVSAALRGESDA